MRLAGFGGRICTLRTSSSPMLAAGNRLGAYEIVAAIGVGGMGEVYRARDTRLKREVALKILPDEQKYPPR